jgi:hypothetical protein
MATGLSLFPIRRGTSPDRGGSDNDLRAGRWLSPAGSCQDGSVSARCESGHPPEHGCHMALVAQPDLLSDFGEGPIGPANQSFACSSRR